jgi:hypothetical protein
VLRKGRRVTKLEEVGLQDDDAGKRVAKLLNSLSYDKLP